MPLETKPQKPQYFWKTLGPGIVTGAADDDPSGIATYSQTGAKFGFGFLWLALFTFPLMSTVQEMCARIGLVTGRGLAGNIRKHFPRWVLHICTILLFVANTFNIGADLGAMAKASQLVMPNVNFAALVIAFGGLTLFLEIFITYGKYANVLKWLAISLCAYILSAFFVGLNVKELLTGTFLPHMEFNRDQIFLLCAILGTTISPYLFFWQTSQEVEEEILGGSTSIKQRQETGKSAIKKMRLDVWLGMFFSNLVMFFIIATAAGTLFKNGVTEIQTAADAAAALKPIAGSYASLLFTIGIIGTGLLAIPVLAGSAAYALSENFGWKEGLYRKFQKAHAFYGVMVVSIILGMLINFTSLDPIKALIYSAVLNGLIAPVILIFVVKISGDKKIMGEHKNGPLSNAVGWLTTVLMVLVAVATVAVLIVP